MEQTFSLKWEQYCTNSAALLVVITFVFNSPEINMLLDLFCQACKYDTSTKVSQTSVPALMEHIHLQWKNNQRRIAGAQINMI